MEIICGRIYRNGIHKACIGIEDGKIVEVKKKIEGKTIDYGEKVIFPSGIDAHVHFREPGHEYKENFFTGSKAASLAGITCILDMPNNKPAIVTKKSFEDKHNKIKNYPICNCLNYTILKLRLLLF